MTTSADGGKPPVYSVSSLIVYEVCPFQYFTTFVQGIPPPITPGMRTGTSIHKLIADHLKEPKLFPAEAPADMREMFDRFRGSRFNLPPVAVERAFRLPLQRGDVRGRIDVVLPRGESGLEIVDFKSGSLRSRDDLARSLQLLLYALAVSQRFDKAPDELAYTYYYLQEGAEVSFQPTVESFDALRHRVDGIMQAIEEGRFDPTKGCECHACTRSRRRSRRSRKAPRSEVGPLPAPVRAPTDGK